LRISTTATRCSTKILKALAKLPTDDAVRYLMSHGTAETDARFLIALTNGEIGDDARPARTGPDARTA
jgi:hypothetical protein